MKILSRYIIHTTISATLLILVIFMGLLFFLSLLTELKNIGEGDYHLWQVLSYVLFKLPHQLYQFSSLFILLASVIALGVLSSHKELIMMRAGGFSIHQLMQSALFAVIFLIFCNILMGELVAPYLTYLAEIKKENAKNAGQAIVTRNGVWFHVDNNFIYVKNVVDRHRLEKVTRYQFDKNQRLQAAYFTDKLTLQNHTWSMNNLVKTSFMQNRTKSEVFAKATWELMFNANLLNAGLLDPEEMSLARLYHFINYLQQNHLQSTEYEYEFWQRVFRPLATLLMIGLAIPIVLASQTTTLSRHLLIGLLIGFGFFILNALLGQLSIVFQLSAFYAALFPLLFFLLLSLILFKILRKRS